MKILRLIVIILFTLCVQYVYSNDITNSKLTQPKLFSLGITHGYQTTYYNGVSVCPFISANLVYVSKIPVTFSVGTTANIRNGKVTFIPFVGISVSCTIVRFGNRKNN